MFEEYPDVLDFKEFKAILDIGDSLAYKLLRENQVKNVKVGTLYRIKKQNVIDYLNNDIA